MMIIIIEIIIIIIIKTMIIIITIIAPVDNGIRYYYDNCYKINDKDK